MSKATSVMKHKSKHSSELPRSSSELTGELLPTRYTVKNNYNCNSYKILTFIAYRITESMAIEKRSFSCPINPTSKSKHPKMLVRT